MLCGGCCRRLLCIRANIMRWRLVFVAGQRRRFIISTSSYKCVLFRPHASRERNIVRFCSCLQCSNVSAFYITNAIMTCYCIRDCRRSHLALLGRRWWRRLWCGQR